MKKKIHSAQIDLSGLDKYYVKKEKKENKDNHYYGYDSEGVEGLHRLPERREIRQITKVDRVAGQSQSLINSSSSRKLIDIYKAEPELNGEVTLHRDFDNSNEDHFYYNKGHLILDGTARPKKSYEIEASDIKEVENYIEETFEINTENFKSIKGIL